MDAENSQRFRILPNGSEPFGNLQNDSEIFGSVPNISERKEKYTLTVKQAMRRFEEAGIPRSDHTITNWCKLRPDPKDPTGSQVSRLDCDYDFQERKWFINPESLEVVIAEEKDRKQVGTIPPSSEPFGNLPSHSEVPPPSVPNASEEVRQTSDRGGESDDRDARIKELEKEIFDLKILNAGKDFLSSG